MVQSEVTKIAHQIKNCFKRQGKLIICGNGGSAQQANHFAAELVHLKLPAISLTADISVITALSNDHSYKEVFARQLIALGKPEDLLIGLSTSGKSKNVLEAYKWADKLNIEWIDFPRKKGFNTPRVQEQQLRLLHDICEIIRKGEIWWSKPRPLSV